MTLTEVAWTCSSPVKEGKTCGPHYHLCVSGVRGTADTIDMLDRDDLELLRDMLNEIIRVDDSLGKGGER